MVYKATFIVIIINDANTVRKTQNFANVGSFRLSEIFSLAEVLAHGGLTPAEHSEIFRLDQQHSQTVLEYLVQIRLLQGEGEDRYGRPRIYTVNPLFYRPLTNVLNSMHILY